MGARFLRPASSLRRRCRSSKRRAASTPLPLELGVCHRRRKGRNNIFEFVSICLAEDIVCVYT